MAKGCTIKGFLTAPLLASPSVPRSFPITSTNPLTPYFLTCGSGGIPEVAVSCASERGQGKRNSGTPPCLAIPFMNKDKSFHLWSGGEGGDTKCLNASSYHPSSLVRDETTSSWRSGQMRRHSRAPLCLPPFQSTWHDSGKVCAWSWREGAAHRCESTTPGPLG